ncbi:uncharacterized protein LOC130629553 isoform X2 [Hydractinia symbiolongicarpus]|uniref:uncharacterized protein LOC130629553 isoform X2 n=1 Tax=Hydractinia symbiolongicarpus TaxID=13093 RepID=UPI00254C28E9|nr:uncharacterized protein LOC130629553 isoform X2 [Hydractinia symbiolongicarpus]
MSTSHVVKRRENSERKKLNRKSKLFYVSCDYLDVNNDDGSIQSGYVLNVHSDPLNINVDQNSEKAVRERKKKNRKSKLFYVSYDHINVDGNHKENDSHLGNDSTSEDGVSQSQSSFDSITLPSNIAYSSTDSTPVNTSSASSGRSTPCVKKRPKRPEIKISDHRHYKDYLEIRRTESLSSLNSDIDGSITSDGSFLHIPEDVIAQAVLSDLNCSPGYDSPLHEFEETLRESTKTPPNGIEIRSSDIQKLCDRRPDSPTSQFLQPILSTNSENIINELHMKISPLLHKLKQVEEDSKRMSSLHVKLAVLQEEKRQLAAMLEQKRHTNECLISEQKINSTQISDEICNAEEIIVVQSAPPDNNIYKSYEAGETCSNKKMKDASVQKHLEIFTEIVHQGTSTNVMKQRSIGVGDGIAHLKHVECATQDAVKSSEFSCQYDIQYPRRDCSTETYTPRYLDAATGDSIADVVSMTAFTQFSPTQVSSSTQSMQPDMFSQEVMVGIAYKDVVDTGVGDNMVEVKCSDQETQITVKETLEKDTQVLLEYSDESTSAGCSLSRMKSRTVQCAPIYCDFACGENNAECITSDKSINNVPIVQDVSTDTEPITTADIGTSCYIVNETISIGVGDKSIYDVLCDKCVNKQVRSVGVGLYENNEPCCVSDKLCNCIKPQCNSIGVGEHSILDVCCDKCENLKQVSVGVSDHKIDDLLCDKCMHLKIVDVASGDSRVDDLLCDTCTNKGDLLDKSVGDFLINNAVSVGCGDEDVNDASCENCKESKNETMFNFDLNILNQKPQVQQQAVLCHYCGNKVDLNDSNLEESLQAMRESMQSVSCGMKRSTASKNLHFDLDTEDSGIYSHKDSSLDSPISDEYHAVVSDDDEDTSGSGRNDVIEACQMLHQHFSGEKPLKQQQMLKYMGIIQTLWFKTVKRRRANASVVKSYIDLFHQRIPELMETIINLTDDEGNTALHYALTYKNYAVVSILLDSGECAVDLVNQAGYSPIMLAALAGFEKKNDKYVMQRLLRMGDINKESADTGQTPLMLAVSRGNLGTVDLLLDAGCDVNAIDDEGSTALMCSCEHGNINIVKALLAHPGCDATIEDNEGSTALSIAMDARRKDLALLIYGSLNFDARGRIKLSPSKQSLLGLGRRSPSPVIGRR